MKKLKARIIDLNGYKAILVIEDAKPTLVNAIRRAIISEIPIFAVDEVIFFENSTPFFDEYIAHRLAMIPLKTSMDVVKTDPNRTVILELEREAKESTETIYSGDLKSSDPLVIPASNRIPIIKMRQGQRIRFQAIARVGRGKNHSKWQAAAAVGYSFMPMYEFERSLLKLCNLSKCDGCMKKKRKIVKVEYPTIYNGCLEELEKCRLNNPGKVKREWDQSRIILRYESTGSLTPSEIFLEALDQLKLKFNELSNGIR